jgi:hypothetical protein|tara:strand:+ start:319 stop:534 length:216 start_codon:yes stop_codon:yes gene_type:complete
LNVERFSIQQSSIDKKTNNLQAVQLKQGRLRQEVMEYPMTLEWFPLRKRVDANADPPCSVAIFGQPAKISG